MKPAVDDQKLKDEFNEKGHFKKFAEPAEENFHTYVQNGFKDIQNRGLIGNNKKIFDEI